MLYISNSPKIIEVRKCGDCFKKQKQLRRDDGKVGENDGGKTQKSVLMWEMLALEHERESPSGVAATDSNSGWSVKVPNMVFDGTKGWQKRPPDSHPLLELSVRADSSDYKYINLQNPK